VRTLVALSVAVLAAVGTGVGVIAATSARGNRAAAASYLDALFASAPLPLGAAAATTEREVESFAPIGFDPDGYVLDRRGLWKVPESATRAASGIAAALGLRCAITDVFGVRELGVGFSSAAGYGLRPDVLQTSCNIPVDPPLYVARLDYVIAPTGAHSALVRIDANVGWLPVRPGSEEVPADTAVVRVIQATSTIGRSPVISVTKAATVSDVEAINRLAVMIAGLALVPAGAISCLGSNATLSMLPYVYTMTFMTSALASGPAALSVTLAGCGYLEVSAAGHLLPVLLDGKAMPVERAIARILGIELPLPRYT